MVAFIAPGETVVMLFESMSLCFMSFPWQVLPTSLRRRSHYDGLNPNGDVSIW